MSHSQEQIIGPSSASPRLALGVAAVLTLLSLAALGGAPAEEAPALRADQAAAPQPVFDGRGKWSGYAR